MLASLYHGALGMVVLSGALLSGTGLLVHLSLLGGCILDIGLVWRNTVPGSLKISYLLGWFGFGKASGNGSRSRVFDAGVVLCAALGALLSRQTRRVCQDTQSCAVIIWKYEIRRHNLPLYSTLGSFCLLVIHCVPYEDNGGS